MAELPPDPGGIAGIVERGRKKPQAREAGGGSTFMEGRGARYPDLPLVQIRANSLAHLGMDFLRSGRAGVATIETPGAVAGGFRPIQSGQSVDRFAELRERHEKMKFENDRFLEAGIKHYVRARDTIIAFEEGIGNVVKQAVENRKDWHPLKRAKIGKVSASSGGQYGYWIAIEITGKSPRGENTVVDCGLWWKWEDVPGPFIYASYYKQPKRVSNFTWKSKGKKIQSFSKWQRTFLYLPLRRVADIKKSLNVLLSALLKQLA